MTNPPNPNIARHTVQGSAYSVAASVITLGLGFLRASLMAQMLMPDQVAVAALALFYLDLASQLGRMGLPSAFIHRQELGPKGRETYFTMSLLMGLVGWLALAAGTPLIVHFYPDYANIQWFILAFVAGDIFRVLSTVRGTITSKELAFDRLAIVDILSSITMTIVGPWMAWQGFGAWSIVGEQLSGLVARYLALTFSYRIGRLRFGWDAELARWFWNYGLKIWWSTNLTFLIDRFDDFWISVAIGKNPLGFYSKAYDFARYPRRVVANPILSVFFPTFAHLQDDRLKLSRAFFRATSLMVRAGSLFSLIFILTAPEFIRIFLGEQWLPMQLTFQLMILYTLLDPLTIAAQNVLMATGHPEVILSTRIIQALVFVPAVIGLGALWGIAGVALAADLMVLTGAVLLYHQTRRVVDYSQRTLWLWPLVGMVLTALAVLLLDQLWQDWYTWVTLLVKSCLISTLFLAFLWLVERDVLKIGLRMIWGMIKPAAK